MFNTSCEGFNGFFAQMAQYGILKIEDAQCFSVEGYIAPGSIILAVAAIILALVNTIVNKAVKQYFYNQKAELEKELFPEDGISGISGDEESHGTEGLVDTSAERIHPVPVMFTDTFRWLLIGDTVKTHETSISIQDGISEKRVEPALPAEQPGSINNENGLKGEHNTNGRTTSSVTCSSSESNTPMGANSKTKKKKSKKSKKTEQGLEQIASLEIDM
jgi:hypothetical protein